MPKISIIDFVKDHNLLNLKLSPAQETLLCTIYGLPLNEEQLALFKLCTGRSEYTEKPYQEVTVIAGARAGKDSRIACPIVVYEAIFGGHHERLAKGERGMISLVASDAEQTEVAFSYISDYFTSSDLLSGELAEEPYRRKIILKNGLIIKCFPSTMRSMRGWTIPVGLLDELAFFRLEGNADSDKEIQRSIERGQISVQFPKLIKITTPYMKSGVVHDDYKQAWGVDDPDILVWWASSKLMNPSLEDEKLARAKRRDHESYLREYEAQFAEDIESFLSSFDIDRATDKNVKERQFREAFHYAAGCDPSGGGRDDFTLSICHSEGERIVQDLIKGWGKVGEESPNLAAVVGEIKTILRRYRLSTVYGDKYAGQWVRQKFQEIGIAYVDPGVDKSEAYLEMEPLFTQGRISILDNDRQTQQLRWLEKKPRAGGKTIVDHPQKKHDDYPNALAIAITGLTTGVTISQFRTFGEVESAVMEP